MHIKCRETEFADEVTCTAHALHVNRANHSFPLQCGQISLLCHSFSLPEVWVEASLCFTLALEHFHLLPVFGESTMGSKSASQVWKRETVQRMSQLGGLVGERGESRRTFSNTSSPSTCRNLFCHRFSGRDLGRVSVKDYPKSRPA